VRKTERRGERAREKREGRERLRVAELRTYQSIKFERQLKRNYEL
jgi:hypothetical protein